MQRRFGRWLVLVTAMSAIAAPSARADAAHTVAPGESLWSIAAADGLSPYDLAAANGVSPDAELLAGSTVVIPGGEGSAPAASATGGAYTVSDGDTLSGIAASAAVSSGDLAAANGLSVDSPLLAGSTLTIPGGGGASGSAGDAPIATPGTVTSDQIAEIASSHDLSPSLATAVAYQESGFDNAAVSSAGARGVMQIMPRTWDFIQGSLSPYALDPYSPTDNVDAGVQYLGYLADQTGNDPVNTVASYYQGLGSVQQDGLYSDTNSYVDSVLSLRNDFGGR
jgi:LysM repeat protein